MFSRYSDTCFDQKPLGRQGCEFSLTKDRCNLRNFIIYTLILCLIIFVCKRLLEYTPQITRYVELKEPVVVYFISLVIIILLLTILLSNQTQSESVLVIASVGINIKTVNGLGCISTEFFSINQIHDVVIIEAISMQSVVSYLAIIMKDGNKDKQKIFPVFKNIKPDLKQLQVMYRSIQEVIHQCPGTS